MVGALAGPTVVAAACTQRCPVKGMDRLAIRRLESEMHLRDIALRLVDEELIGIKETRAFDDDVRQTEARKHGAIEALARLQVGHMQVDVIEQSAAMEFHALLLGEATIAPCRASHSC